MVFSYGCMYRNLFRTQNWVWHLKRSVGGRTSGLRHLGHFSRVKKGLVCTLVCDIFIQTLPSGHQLHSQLSHLSNLCSNGQLLEQNWMSTARLVIELQTTFLWIVFICSSSSVDEQINYQMIVSDIPSLYILVIYKICNNIILDFNKTWLYHCLHEMFQEGENQT